MVNSTSSINNVAHIINTHYHIPSVLLTAARIIYKSPSRLLDGLFFCCHVGV